MAIITRVTKAETLKPICSVLIVCGQFIDSNKAGPPEIPSILTSEFSHKEGYS
jgi:hypothetical protein